MLLTPENYHSIESNKKYMSNSQYKSFLECEAKALAEVEGRWKPATSDAFLVGEYIHSWNESPEALALFKANTPELFTQKGELRANFKFAEEMITALENDLFCMDMLQGQKEVILTAEMFGTPWKIKIDSYREDAIVDLKTTRSIWELQYSTKHNQKVSFIEMYDYWLQMAVYAEVERLHSNRDKHLDTYIVAVSKETPPDKAIFVLDNPERIKFELAEVQHNIPRILEVKNGFVEPSSCGRCAYCRSTQVVNKIYSYRELEQEVN